MKEKFTFFYRTASPFSQWHPVKFVIEGITFNCAEQYMMYMKAKLFGDEEIAERIINASEPREQKALGRKVKNFDQTKWEENCQQLVYEGNYAKFTQNQALKQALLDTAGTTLVEASPTDCIWGVGLSEHDLQIQDRLTWRGKNYLGEILTRLREDLLRENQG